MMHITTVSLVLCLVAAVLAQQNQEYAILNTCDQSAHWDLSYLSTDQTIRLKSNTNYCLDISGYGTTDGSYVWLYQCHTSDKDPTHQNQEFIYDSTAKTFTNPESGKVLDASNYGTSPGTRIWIWEKTGATNQQWEYNTTDSTIRGVASGLCLDVEAAGPRACDVAANKALPFCDTSLTFAQRAADLVSRIPDAQKWGLFGNGATGVFNLSISPYQWWSEALHGVAGSPGVSFSGSTPYATSFPQVCVTASAFDVEMWADIGTAIGTEGRAFANEGNAGLTFWTPNLNIFRDPRWGRGQETPGEDPYLNAQYVKYYVAALQGNNENDYLQISSCCKHYAAYNLDDWEGYDRCSFNAIVTEQDLTDTYLPAFESCISPASAGGSGIMCSYNAVNGIPSCANEFLLNETARNKWGFNGYITGDCGAVQCVQDNHHYTSTSDETCKAVLTAGLDIDCGSFLPQYLAQAVSDGAVSMDLVNSHLVNLFQVQMRLGMYDPLELQPYAKYNASNVNTPEHQQLAELAALRGIVLLKNINNVLPLSKSLGSVAVIGPNAQATTVLQGNYYGNAPYLISPVQGISAYVKTVYAQGSTISTNDTSGIAAACTAASGADATIIVAGLDNTQEAEAHDRTIISWPGVQEQMILKVASCSKGPVVLVVFGGGPIDMTQEKITNSIGAIMWAGYPGQSGGTALAKLIFGDVSPSGRLIHTTYPANFVNQIGENDMGMRPNTTTGNPGRTYRFYTGQPVYEFGFGLSYTNFTFTWSNTSDTISAFEAGKIQSIVSDPYYSRVSATPLTAVQVVVKNVGTVTSDVSALLFSVGPNPGQNGNPIKSLTGFGRINGLAPGQSQTVQFPVSAHDLSIVDDNGKLKAETGVWKFMVEDIITEIEVYN